MTELPVHEFGEFRVDLRRMVLTRADVPVAIEPKAFDVLRYLIEHRDRLVTKDELLDVAWKDTFVTPNALTRAVAQVRSALGDDAAKPRFVETLPKRGYRFVASVQSWSDRSVPAGPINRSHPSGQRRHIWASVLASLAVLIAIGVGLFRLVPASPRGVRGSILPRRLTTRMGKNTWPAMAPDGRSIAYVSDQTGRPEIYVIGFAPGGREVAITNDSGENIQPAWSPDGAWIAFHSMARGGIWIAPATGGSPRQVVEIGSEPAWSPDGSRLVFSSSEGGMATQSTLWTVTADGRDRRPLTELGTPAGGHREPTWSHDGRFIAFTDWLSGGPTVWIVAAAGGEAPRPLVKELSHFAAFGPDDRTLYWSGPASKSDPAGADRLRGLPLDANGHAAGEAFSIAPLADGRIEGVAIARNGTLAYGLQTSDINLWSADVTNPERPGEPIRLTDDIVRNSHPDYSSTGRIAYVQYTGNAFTTWVMNEDGTNREPLVPGLPSYFPRWTPDGNRLLVSIASADRNVSLSWVDMATRRVTPTPLTGIPFDRLIEPRLSPDLRELTFHTIEDSGAMNVWTRALDGSSETRLTKDAEAISYPAWSPDGQWLAVEIKRGEQTHIGVMSRRGGAIEQLTNDRGQSWPYSWSPDGERIVFAGERGGVWNVFEVSRRTKLVRALTAFTSSSGYVRYPSWSPRGNRVVFERGIETSGIWTLQLP